MERSTRDMMSHTAPWTFYAMAISEREDTRFRVAVGSFVEDETNNFVQLVTFDAQRARVQNTEVVSHDYPPSKIMFLPSNINRNPDLFATTGDYLRLYRNSSEGFVSQSIFDQNQTGKYSAPLTSFDWCRTDLSMIVTSSIDTTCTLWDIKKKRKITQLVAHDMEVFDVTFDVQNRNLFTTCGADHSVRMFDLRGLEHSTILYESSRGYVVRVGWNKVDPNYMAVLSIDSPSIQLLDLRIPNRAVSSLVASAPASPLNAFDWSPSSGAHMITAGDDSQVLIWDTQQAAHTGIDGDVDPVLGFCAKKEVNSVRWSHRAPKWVLIGMDNELQFLKV